MPEITIRLMTPDETREWLLSDSDFPESQAALAEFLRFTDGVARASKHATLDIQAALRCLSDFDSIIRVPAIACGYVFTRGTVRRCMDCTWQRPFPDSDKPSGPCEACRNFTPSPAQVCTFCGEPELPGMRLCWNHNEWLRPLIAACAEAA